MKKTILTIMVAAMMLVAFTACEQQVPDLNGQVPTNAIITQTGTFVEGQMFDPTQFSVKLTYKNGYTETVSGANLVTLDSKEAYVVPGDTVSVNVTTVGGTSNGQQMIGKAQLNVKTIESVTVVAPETLDVGSDVSSNAVKSLFTVTANYDGGTIAVKPSEFTINNLSVGKADEDDDNLINENVVINVYLAAPQGTGSNPVAVSDKFSVKIVDPEAKPAEFEWDGKTIAYSITDEQIFGRQAFDDSMITFYKKMVDKNDSNNVKYEEIVLGQYDSITVTLATTYNATATAAGLTIPEGVQLFADATSNTATVAYKYADENGKYVTVGNATGITTPSVEGLVEFTEENPDGKVKTGTTTITFATIKDYATQITAAWDYFTAETAVRDEKATVKGTAYTKSDVTVTVTTWKSGLQNLAGYSTASSAEAKAIKEVADTAFTIDPTLAPSDVTAAGFQTVEVELNAHEYIDSADPTTCQIWVKLA